MVTSQKALYLFSPCHCFSKHFQPLQPKSNSFSHVTQLIRMKHFYLAYKYQGTIQASLPRLCSNMITCYVSEVQILKYEHT